MSVIHWQAIRDVAANTGFDHRALNGAKEGFGFCSRRFVATDRNDGDVKMAGIRRFDADLTNDPVVDAKLEPFPATHGVIEKAVQCTGHGMVAEQDDASKILGE